MEIDKMTLYAITTLYEKIEYYSSNLALCRTLYDEQCERMLIRFEKMGIDRYETDKYIIKKVKDKIEIVLKQKENEEEDEE